MFPGCILPWKRGDGRIYSESMKILPVLFCVAFCVAAYAQEKDKELAAEFLHTGKSYLFEFSEGARIDRGVYTIVGSTQLPNWFLVERQNGSKFLLNANAYSAIYELNKDGSIIPEKVSKPTGTPPSK